MVTPHVGYLAHHWLLLAVPAFLPAIIVVAVILYVALKDRRSGGGEPTDQRPGGADENSD